MTDLDALCEQLAPAVAEACGFGYLGWEYCDAKFREAVSAGVQVGVKYAADAYLGKLPHRGGTE